uniref:WD_REPEATS_REGION domain-containing protein n=1 Tax=Macrostomum lignano TaxID=282301 RepID=A0A1I8HZR4_9PLAT
TRWTHGNPFSQLSAGGISRQNFRVPLKPLSKPQPRRFQLLPRLLQRHGKVDATAAALTVSCGHRGGGRQVGSPQSQLGGLSQPALQLCPTVPVQRQAPFGLLNCLCRHRAGRLLLSQSAIGKVSRPVAEGSYTVGHVGAASLVLQAPIPLVAAPPQSLQALREALAGSPGLRINSRRVELVPQLRHLGQQAGQLLGLGIADSAVPLDSVRYAGRVALGHGGVVGVQQLAEAVQLAVELVAGTPEAVVTHLGVELLAALLWATFFARLAAAATSGSAVSPEEAAAAELLRAAASASTKAELPNLIHRKLQQRIIKKRVGFFSGLASRGLVGVQQRLHLQQRVLGALAVGQQAQQRARRFKRLRALLERGAQSVPGGTSRLSQLGRRAAHRPATLQVPLHPIPLGIRGVFEVLQAKQLLRSSAPVVGLLGVGGDRGHPRQLRPDQVVDLRVRRHISALSAASILAEARSAWASKLARRVSMERRSSSARTPGARALAAAAESRQAGRRCAAARSHRTFSASSSRRSCSTCSDDADSTDGARTAARDSTLASAFANGSEGGGPALEACKSVIEDGLHRDGVVDDLLDLCQGFRHFHVGQSFVQLSGQFVGGLGHRCRLGRRHVVGQLSQQVVHLWPGVVQPGFDGLPLPGQRQQLVSSFQLSDSLLLPSLQPVECVFNSTLSGRDQLSVVRIQPAGQTGRTISKALASRPSSDGMDSSFSSAACISSQASRLYSCTSAAWGRGLVVRPALGIVLQESQIVAQILRHFGHGFVRLAGRFRFRLQRRHSRLERRQRRSLKIVERVAQPGALLSVGAILLGGGRHQVESGSVATGLQSGALLGRLAPQLGQASAPGIVGLGRLRNGRGEIGQALFEAGQSLQGLLGRLSLLIRVGRGRRRGWIAGLKRAGGGGGKDVCSQLSSSRCSDSARSTDSCLARAACCSCRVRPHLLLPLRQHSLQLLHLFDQLLRFLASVAAAARGLGLLQQLLHRRPPGRQLRLQARLALLKQPLRLRRLWRRRLGRVGHGGRRHQALVGPKQLAVQTGRQLPVRLRLVQLVPPFGQLRRQTVAGGLLLADGGQDGLGVVVTPAGQLLGQLGQLCRLHCALGQPLFQNGFLNLFEEIHRPTSCLSCWALADRSSSTTGARAASLASRSTIEGFLSIRVSFSLQLLCRLWSEAPAPPSPPRRLGAAFFAYRCRRRPSDGSGPPQMAASLPATRPVRLPRRQSRPAQRRRAARDADALWQRALMPEPHLRWPAETPPSDGPPGRAPCVATVPTPSGLSSLLRRPRRLPALSAGRRGVAARRRVPPRLCPRRAGIAEPSLRFDARGAGAAPRQLGRRALLAGAAAAPTAVDREGRQQLPAERQATALRLRCWPTAGPAAALHRLQWPVRPLMLGDAVVDVAERTLLFRTCGVSFKRRMKDSLVWYCPVVRLRGPASDASSSLFNALAASASSSSFSRRSHSSRSRPPAISDTSSAKSASFSSRASMNADSLGCTSLTARPSYQGPPLVQILQQRLGLIRRFVRPLCRRPSLGRQLRRPGHRRRLLGRGRGVSQQLLGQAVQLVQSALVGRHLLEVLLAALPDSGGAIGQHQVGRLVSGQGGLLPGQPVVEGFGQFEEAKLPDSLGERALARGRQRLQVGEGGVQLLHAVPDGRPLRLRQAAAATLATTAPAAEASPAPTVQIAGRATKSWTANSDGTVLQFGGAFKHTSCIFISVTSSSYGSSTAINGSSSPSATAESSADCSSPSLKSSSSSSSPRLLCTSSVVSWNSGVLSRQFARRLCAAKGLQLLAQILVTLEQRGCRAGVVPDVPTGQQRRHAGHVIVGLAGRGKELLSVQALSCIGLAGVQQSAKVAPAGAQAAQPVADSLLALLRRLDGDFIAVVNVAAVVGSVLQLSGLAGVFIFAAANQLKEISRCLQATPPVGERLQQALVVLLQRHQLLAQRHRRSAGRAAVAETPGSACDAVHLNGEATSSKINKSAKTFLKLTCSCKAINSCSEILCLARKFSHDIRSVPVSHEVTDSRRACGLKFFHGSQGGLLLSEGLGQASPPGADVVSVARHDGLVVIILFNKALCGLNGSKRMASWLWMALCTRSSRSQASSASFSESSPTLRLATALPNSARVFRRAGSMTLVKWRARFSSSSWRSSSATKAASRACSAASRRAQAWPRSSRVLIEAPFLLLQAGNRIGEAAALQPGDLAANPVQQAAGVGFVLLRPSGAILHVVKKIANPLGARLLGLGSVQRRIEIRDVDDDRLLVRIVNGDVLGVENAELVGRNVEGVIEIGEPVGRVQLGEVEGFGPVRMNQRVECHAVAPGLVKVLHRDAVGVASSLLLAPQQQGLVHGFGALGDGLRRQLLCNHSNVIVTDHLPDEPKRQRDITIDDVLVADANNNWLAVAQRSSSRVAHAFPGCTQHVQRSGHIVHPLDTEPRFGRPMLTFWSTSTSRISRRPSRRSSSKFFTLYCCSVRNRFVQRSNVFFWTFSRSLFSSLDCCSICSSFCGILSFYFCIRAYNFHLEHKAQTLVSSNRHSTVSVTEMFVYLSKKIAIPNNVKLQSLSWNKENGYLACGGDDGLLKILKLESQPDGRVKGLAAPSNLTMNQSLEGHSGGVHTIAWNEGHQKITTSDTNGLIIVWMFYKSSWYEEMIKNSRSQVCDMKWNMEGQKICIAYEDGSVIVGSVDGNRIWGKELKLNLKAVAWSPDSKIILFGMKNGDIHIYDHTGNSVCRMEVPKTGPELAGISWFSNRLLARPEVPTPCLAIAFTNGRLLLLRDEADDRPIELDTRLRLRAFNWSHDGSLLACAGHLASQKDTDKDVNTVKFYSSNGEHLRTLKVPGNDITACTWEGGSLRIALAVDSFIYFANVRPRYRWAYCGNTVVYAYNRPDRVENCVVFWDTKNNLRFIKYIAGVTHVAAAGEYCCIAHKPEQETVAAVESGAGKCTLVLCNAIGTPLDTRDLDMDAEQVAMTASHVVVASDRAVYTWQFKDPKQLAVMEVSEKRKAGAEKLFHIDEGAPAEGEGLNFTRVNEKEIRDRICAVGVSAKLVVVARESGAVLQFGLPSMALEVRHRLECTPYELQVNCNSTRLAIIDQSGVLTFFDLEKAAAATAPPKDQEQGASSLPQTFERKDVWHMRFAEDNPDLFAFMEKTRMYVMKGLEVEEPVSSSAYLCQFKDLEIKGVLLDEILKDCPSSPSQDYLLDMEVKALRDMRDLTEKSGIEQSLKFVEEHPHPRLWRLLAECALERQNLQVAEQAYVKCRDYAGVQLIKRRLQNLTSDQLRKAEVAVHFGRFEAAEEIYLKADRKDLAVELCRTVGDWFRLVQLVKSSTGAGTDAVLMEAWEALGDHYSDRQSWQLAIDYYAQAQKEEKLAESYYLLEDYQNLEKVSLQLPDNHKLLPQLAAKFAAIGMGDQAVSAYIRCGLVKDAINTCVQLNQWTTAIELAKQHNLRDIDALLTQYANHLLDKNKLVNAVELYRKAGHFLEAAKYMHKLTMDEVKKGSSPMKIKKMFVLVGMLIEQYHEQSKTQAKSKA